jgi:hypothetical protein
MTLCELVLGKHEQRTLAVTTRHPHYVTSKEDHAAVSVTALVFSKSRNLMPLRINRYIKTQYYAPFPSFFLLYKYIKTYISIEPIIYATFTNTCSSDLGLINASIYIMKLAVPKNTLHETESLLRLSQKILYSLSYTYV